MMVPEDADICPICQYEFAENRQNKWGVWLIATLLLLLAVYIFILR